MATKTAVKATQNVTRKAVTVKSKAKKPVTVSLTLTLDQVALLAEGMAKSKASWRVLADTPANREKAPDLLSGGLAKMYGMKVAKPAFLVRHALHEMLKAVVADNE